MRLLHALLPLPLLLAAGAAAAHEGHGMPGTSHWHASDVLGIVLAVLAAAGAWWWIRRK